MQEPCLHVINRMVTMRINEGRIITMNAKNYSWKKLVGPEFNSGQAR
jgi:hypothetical protein